MMDDRKVFAILTESDAIPLSALMNAFGLYALWDHEQNVRYIGCTPKATEGFRVRVTNKHVTGTEGRSHKFSQAYCTGGMWRYCRKLHPEAAMSEQRTEDARLAKKLRTAFIREYCKATFVEIPKGSTPPDYFGCLTALESRLQQMAPSSMRAWEGIRFPSVPEPAVLVDALLEKMPQIKEAATRQAALYAKYGLANA